MKRNLDLSLLLVALPVMFGLAWVGFLVWAIYSVVTWLVSK
jgi:hypothetical protein